jgi:mRNA interferase RelE/StbE
MADYKITFARSARRELEALEPSLVRRIFPRIEALSQETRPKGCRKLRGEKNLWRIRVGNYRVVYAIYYDKQVVDVIAVRHRNASYK